MPGAGSRPRLDRRGFLTGSAGAAACLLAPLPGRGQEAAATDATATEATATDATATGAVATTVIADGVATATGLGGNIAVLATAAGAVVVDSGAAPHASRVAALVEEQTGEPGVAALFNTHWHRDQVGGNAVLRERGARVIAHAKTRAHLTTPYYLPGEDRYQPPLAPAGHPTESFFDTGSIEVGGERIDYGYLLEAHTDGDIYVRFTGRNVIAAGDAISPERDPVIDWYGGGWLGGRIDSLELLLAMSDGATRFVPSYGPVVDRSYVETEHSLMLALYDIMFERVRAGESAADSLASGALDALPRRFDDPGKLLYDVHKSLWAHYNTISPDIV